MKLIVGLGNPGTQYTFSRHNIGFLFIDYLADFFNIKIHKKNFNSLWGTGSFRNICITLAKPRMFMNKSGASVFKLASYFNLEGGDLIVIHDDIDLPFGKIRIKRGGGHGGHNGVRSIIEHLECSSFVRIKVGISRPERADIPIEDYVLEFFTEFERSALNDLIVSVKDATVSIILDGIESAMNQCN